VQVRIREEYSERINKRVICIKITLINKKWYY